MLNARCRPAPRYVLLSLGAPIPLVVDKEGFLNFDDAEVRKMYLRISQKIHPDKLPHYADATAAFQKCARAYELVCKPELRADEEDDSRSEVEVGDEDHEDLKKAEGSGLANKARKPRKTRQPAEARAAKGKRAKAGKPKRDKKPHDRSAPVSSGKEKKKRSRVSRVSSSSEEVGEEADDDSDVPLAARASARSKSKKCASKDKAFIDDEEDEGGWTSSSADDEAEDEDEDEEEADLGELLFSKKDKKPALPKLMKARSNSNCYRTTVACPKCRAEWGHHLKAEGQEFSYSLFMQGLRQVHCLRCLFEFGALTAGHKCPHCKKPFTYMPSMYNKKITHTQCKKKFGIYNFVASKAKEDEHLMKIAEEEAKRRRKEEAAESRAQRARNFAEIDDGDFDMVLGQLIVSFRV